MTEVATPKAESKMERFQRRLNDFNLTKFYYLKEAYREAEKFSTDPSTQNGAVLVDEYGLIVARGANHFPSGVAYSDQRWVKPLKYSFVEHAERNAIFSAAKKGIKTDGLIMVCPWFACTDCARAIIQSGIAGVIGHKFMLDGTPPAWMESIKIALTMLDEAGVPYEYIDGKVGDVKIRFNGQIVEP